MLRNPNSIPSGDTVIQDKVMEPFFIAKSQSGGYTVYERVIKGENKTEYIKTISYPSNFNAALKTVVKERLNNGESKVYDLNQYVNRYETIHNEISSRFNF
jgi:hypothetical protein|tara:strand:+ start:1975 stop:2277 length:303 start_codon:yes stop_codon:yes gene_type:complete